jgi:hypothetical protein
MVVPSTSLYRGFTVLAINIRLPSIVTYTAVDDDDDDDDVDDCGDVVNLNV